MCSTVGGCDRGDPVRVGHRKAVFRFSMAVMLLYLLDKEFGKSRPIDLSDF